MPSILIIDDEKAIRKTLAEILSYEGYKINDLAKIFSVNRKTIMDWLNDWDDFSLVGLYEQKGRGRKPKLNDEQKELVQKWESRKSTKFICSDKKRKRIMGNLY